MRLPRAWAARRLVARTSSATGRSDGQDGKTTRSASSTAVGPVTSWTIGPSAVRMPRPSSVQTMGSQPSAKPCRPTSPNTIRGAARWNMVMPSKAYTAIRILGPISSKGVIRATHGTSVGWAKMDAIPFASLPKENSHDRAAPSTHRRRRPAGVLQGDPADPGSRHATRRSPTSWPPSKSQSEQDLPVVVVQHQLPEGAPAFAVGSESWSLHPEIEQRLQPAWKRVTKDKGSVFAGTDVAAWLAEQDVDTITIVGYMTNNCDLATAVERRGARPRSRDPRLTPVAPSTWPTRLARSPPISCTRRSSCSCTPTLPPSPRPRPGPRPSRVVKPFPRATSGHPRRRGVPPSRAD